MKCIYLYLFLVTFLFAACNSASRLPKTTEDKSLFALLKKFDKDPSNTELKTTITRI